jgi:eukaryotic-like serine/threonine-protein kinase
MTEIEIWTKWESQIVNGQFPLRRFLGRSNHSVVFLTEYQAQKAAIKLVPGDPATEEAQLAHWKAIAALSHPNLMRILSAGRCALGGHPFLFVVMDYADQTLAQILPHRPLNLDEVREFLAPVLGALAYLHRKNLVQGQLKPPNFLVVNDRLKLASDTIRTTGERASSGAKPSIYDAPETKVAGISAAGDVWGLGVSLVEALTQSPPAWPGKQSDTVSLPATLPPEFADALQRCLSRTPALRPTIAELTALFIPPPLPAAPAVAEPFTPAAPAPAQIPLPQAVRAKYAPTQNPTAGRWRIPAAAVGLGLIVLLVTWAAVRPFHRHSSGALLPASGTAQPSSQASVQTAPSPNPAAPTSAAGVIHQEIPAVSRRARDSIRGQVKVSVVVTVERTGIVIAETLEDRGPSRFFAKSATDAAKKWRFAPADGADSRQWLLQFEFTRAGVAVQAAPRSANRQAASGH